MCTVQYTVKRYFEKMYLLTPSSKYMIVAVYHKMNVIKMQELYGVNIYGSAAKEMNGLWEKNRWINEWLDARIDYSLMHGSVNAELNTWRDGKLR